MNNLNLFLLYFFISGIIAYCISNSIEYSKKDELKTFIFFMLTGWFLLPFAMLVATGIKFFLGRK